MAYFHNPTFAAEPYEESSGGRPLQTVASPEDLQAYYQVMERQESLQRKLSKRKTNTGTSIWSRKSLKRTATAPSAQPNPQKTSLQTSTSLDLDPRQHQGQRDEQEREMEKLEEQKEKFDRVPQMNSPRSIIPDSLKEAPAWYNKDTWAAAPPPSHKMRYNIHNPVGPRWYRNHHLIPPSQIRPAVRPPSVFSPSFPPMASATSHDRSEDTTRLPLPQTSSNSSLPTPSSSQTRVGDATKPRSRKTSQTAHDNVDLLDVTDPWGTNWHHQSPYDIGLTSSDQQEPLNARSRRSSLTNAQSKRKTVPSPLSQSTSAIHLQVPGPTIQLPRKLSKRRTPTLGSIWGQHKGNGQSSVSTPATPVESHQQPIDGINAFGRHNRASKQSLLEPSSFSQTSKKEKRGSVLGRLVRKISSLRKPSQERDVVGVGDIDWHQVDTDNVRNGSHFQGSSVEGTQSPPATHTPPEPTRRVRPPSFNPPVPAQVAKPPSEHDRSSVISLETPFSTTGRLTIANPDTPTPDNGSPTPSEAPLPPEKPKSSSPTENRHVVNASPAPTPNQPVQSPNSTPPVTTPVDNRASMEMRPTRPVSAVLETNGPKVAPRPDEPKRISSGLKEDDFSQSVFASLSPAWHAPPTSTSRPISPSKSPAPPIPPKEKSPVSQPSAPITRPVSTKQPLSAAQPFPVMQSTQPKPNDYHLSPNPQAFVDYSPLSTSSMLANPPTPYAPERMMSSPEPPPVVPQKPSQEGKHPARDPSPGAQPATRKTETFKLIRSDSGNVYASSETIVAAGQQWEVVEQVDGKGKSRASEEANKRAKAGRPQEANTRKESRRQDKPRVEPPPQSQSRSHHHRQRSSEQSPTSPTRVNGRHRTPENEPPSSRPEEARRIRRREDERDRDRERTKERERDRDRERGPERERAERRSSEAALNVNKPQPAPPPKTPAPEPLRTLERAPSLTARPTSELPSAADLNALRAKEAWEMERLWKARSMYGTEPNGNPTFVVAATPDSSPGKGSNQPQNYGSSHTSFLVQTPFQHPGSHIYHSMPSGAPPINYSPPSIPSLSSNSPSIYYSANNHRSFTSIPPTDSRVTSPTTRPHLSNPLPPPPRESSYEPAPLPHSYLDATSPRSTDIRTKFSGVTTAF